MEKRSSFISATPAFSKPLGMTTEQHKQNDSSSKTYFEFLEFLSQPSGDSNHQHIMLTPSDLTSGLTGDDHSDHAATCSTATVINIDNGNRLTTPAMDSSILEFKPMPNISRCSYRHGTVYADPYPGYPHGNPKRGICPMGCRPVLYSEVTKSESPMGTLTREAMEYLELYYHERYHEMKGADGFLSKEDRMVMVQESINKTGTYEHTFDELEHGARIAWRNAPKCANRKYWQQLKLLDARDVRTNRQMYDACMHHLSKAMSCGASEAYVTVFKPATHEKDGPRIWNDQLLQYAAYRRGEELRFTEMLAERFGWAGPNDGVIGSYDYLPLVVQVDPQQSPDIFDVPLECPPPVFIHHHRYPGLSSLNMRWYPIPVVSALDMEIGGLKYTAAPFNGWYANTEVVRNLTDESRYNLLVPIAKALGFDADTQPGEAPLWIDEVMAILSAAVYHSFKTAKVAMIDHHNLINMFYMWYNDELKHRKYCPVNWKWVIPPMSPSTSPAYLCLNKAQEYTLKPAFIIGKGFLELEANHFGSRNKTKAMNDLLGAIHLALFFKRVISQFRSRKQPVLIVYASVTGNASKWANKLGSILCMGSNITYFDACRIDPSLDEKVLNAIEVASLTIFVTSTQGNGELPSLSSRFFSCLFSKHSYILSNKQCAVLGFGNSAYPIFCGAAAHLSGKLVACGATEVVARGECDSVKGEELTFYNWTEGLVMELALMPSASPYMVKLSKKIKENTSSNVLQQCTIMNAVLIEVFTADEVQVAAARSLMKQSAHSSSHNSRSKDGTSFSVDKETSSRAQLLIKMIDSSFGCDNPHLECNVLKGIVKGRKDLIDSDCTLRKTSLLKIDLNGCGNPPYQPGDHIRVFPTNVISIEELKSFVDNLSGNVNLDDIIHVSLESNSISLAEVAVTLPVVKQCLKRVIPVGYLLKKVVALRAPLSIQACNALAELATNDSEKSTLKSLAMDAREYQRMISLTGLKWIHVFSIFPSLSKQVSVKFLVCNMNTNHPRSYSISSCKEIVGSEMHLVVGRFVYTQDGSNMEAGICSDFLTSVSPGDDVVFKMESAPQFHHPLDPSCPIIFICNGTGFAPIRGLLQKRGYLKSRGEAMGPAYLIFGSRSSQEGLFHNEIKQFVSKRVLTKSYMCYSQEPGKEKEYTTDKLYSDRVKQVLSPILSRPNTHVFICGSAHMAEQSKIALAVISTKECMENMAAEGRLHFDVFGTFSEKHEH